MSESNWVYDFLDAGLIHELVSIGSGPKGTCFYFITSSEEDIPEFGSLSHLTESGLAKVVERGKNDKGKEYIEYTLTLQGKRVYSQILDVFRKEGRGYRPQE